MFYSSFEKNSFYLIYVDDFGLNETFFEIGEKTRSEERNVIAFFVFSL